VSEDVLRFGAGRHLVWVVRWLDGFFAKCGSYRAKSVESRDLAWRIKRVSDKNGERRHTRRRADLFDIDAVGKELKLKAAA